MKSTSGGGDIELAILSQHFREELHTHTGRAPRLDCVWKEGKYSSRILLFLMGIIMTH